MFMSESLAIFTVKKDTLFYKDYLRKKYIFLHNFILSDLKVILWEKKEKVMLSLPLFATYKPVPFVYHNLPGAAWFRPPKHDVGELV